MTVRARTLADGAAPPSGAPPADRAAGPAPPGSDPQDPDPLHTGPPCLSPSGTCPSGCSSSGVGGAAASALIRAQLRIALRTCAIVLTVVTGLPVLLALVPAIARAGVRGVPLCWLVLALGIQPLWVAVALRQLRRAERAERELTRPASPVDGP
ncbi:hypothetical protein OHR68_23115 [Spirillospora sp. NBC_00431]